eukprot:6178241-Pleurochrysis_carterae.AAC.3
MEASDHVSAESRATASDQSPSRSAWHKSADAQHSERQEGKSRLDDEKAALTFTPHVADPICIQIL